MKNSAETFSENEQLHRQLTTIMTAILKFKTTRTRIRSRKE